MWIGQGEEEEGQDEAGEEGSEGYLLVVDIYRQIMPNLSTTSSRGNSYTLSEARRLIRLREEAWHLVIQALRLEPHVAPCELGDMENKLLQFEQVCVGFPLLLPL